MKKIAYIFLMIALITITSACSKNDSEIKRVEGIENFMVNESENFFLVYPRDERLSKNVTIIKEVDNKGNLVCTFEIKDNNFRRVEISQKPNSDVLYLKMFGLATLDNHFYTLNLKDKKIEKKVVNYMEYDTGINHMLHYGKDIMFSTIVSHLTGEQHLNEKGEFKASISNVSNQTSFETEYGAEMVYAPILQFQNKIIHGTNLGLDSDDNFSGKGISIYNTDDKKTKYIYSDDKYSQHIPFYTNEENFYVLTDNGNFYKYSEDLSKEKINMFAGFDLNNYYFALTYLPIFINETTAIYALESDTKDALVLMDLKNEITKDLTSNLGEKYDSFKLLSYDSSNNEFYLIGLNEENENGDLIVLDTKNYVEKNVIPIEDAHLLDLVIKY